MRAEAFVPGHISSIFRPYRGPDPGTTGSRGTGIRLNMGSKAFVETVPGDEVSIRIDGKESNAAVTRAAVEMMHPEGGLEIEIFHDLPMEQGFGTSASGTFAVCLCLSEMFGGDPVMPTHTAECGYGGGLGDLLAIDSGYAVPVRTVPGPPRFGGVTEDAGISMPCLSLIVLGGPLVTGSVLSDPSAMERISTSADECLEMFAADRTIEGFYRSANRFSASTGLESDAIRDALETIHEEGYHAGMCMLGNSVYSDIPFEEAEKLFPDRRIFQSAPYGGPATVTRTG